MWAILYLKSKACVEYQLQIQIVNNSNQIKLVQNVQIDFL